MSFIYAITNKVNGKQYIGKTNHSIEKRFREHLSDSKRARCKDRPLYRAINKYGDDSFEIKILEEVPYDISCDKEIHWIEHLNTYKDGYNATKGADGKSYLDYEAITATYLKELNITRTAEIHNCHYDSVRYVLILKGIKINKRASADSTIRAVIGKKDGLEISFESIKEADKHIATLLNKPSHYKSHISGCCKGQRKTCAGFTWRYA